MSKLKVQWAVLSLTENVPAKFGRDRVLGKICMNAKDGVKRVTGVETARLQWIWTGQ